MRLFALFVAAVGSQCSFATGPTSTERTIESIAVDVYNQACLSTPIAERGTEEWADRTRATPVEHSEYSNVLIGKQRKVWKAESRRLVYVALSERLGCNVWFTTSSPEAAIEAFRKLVQSEFSRAPKTVRIKPFREGEVRPGFSMMAYVISFPHETTGLMWSVYTLQGENSSRVWYEAQRVRADN